MNRGPINNIQKVISSSAKHIGHLLAVIQNSAIPSRNVRVDADFHFGDPSFTKNSVSSPVHSVTAATIVPEKDTSELLGRKRKKKLLTRQDSNTMRKA